MHRELALADRLKVAEHVCEKAGRLGASCIRVEVAIVAGIGVQVTRVPVGLGDAESSLASGQGVVHLAAIKEIDDAG